jgi:F-type H+-transporting ATPase subunit delta
MYNPRLASRYAKSLIDLSMEKGQLDQVYGDMQYLQQVINSSREFLGLLRSPVITSDKKRTVIDAITAGKISDLTNLFTKLLIAKNRETNLPEIITAFIQQYKQEKNIYVVKLTTAVPVSEEVKNTIVSQVRSTSNMQQIELEAQVNPDLIGGFVLQAGDKLVDASVSNRLKEVARQFENNDFVYKVK